MAQSAPKSRYLTLAALSAVVCMLFGSELGTIHLRAIVATGIVVPIALAWLGGRVPQPAEEPEAARGNVRARRWKWLGGVIFVIVALKFAALGWFGSEFRPALHDEWSYLFGAETIALGRITNPTPPLAEFFDAFHILTTPAWVTRYPPGHPAALAFGVLVGWPALVPIALGAGAAAWTWRLARELGGDTAGAFAAVLVVLASGLDLAATSFFSQSSLLFAITAAICCAIEALRRRSISWSIAAGSLGGWALLTRPFSALALGLPIAVWFLRETWRRPAPQADDDSAIAATARTAELAAATDHRLPITDHPIGNAAHPWAMTLAAASPLIIAVLLLAAYNRATTGHAWRTAWGEYNRRYEPSNTIGFASGSEPDVPDGLDARKHGKAESIATEHAAFTASEAVRRALADPKRAAAMVFPALGFYGLVAFVPFGLIRRREPPRGLAAWPLAAAIAAHYAAYSCFYSTWSEYGIETLPFIIVLAAAGLARFWQRARDSDRPMTALVVPLALAAALGVCVFVQWPGFIRERRADTAYHRRFDETLRPIGAERAIVFVRLDPAKSHPYDLIHNRPDLTAPRLIVLDRGDANADFVRQFPDRKPFVFDEATWTLTPWVPRKDGPARRSIPRDRASVASRR